MEPEAGFLSYGSIGLSTVREHKPSTRLAALKHNHREIAAEIGCAGGIDASRCHLNTVLEGHATAGECEAQALALFNGAKLKKDHTQALELLFSLPPGTGHDPRIYFGACLEWARRHHGLPILSAVIHLDESVPHMHLLLLPIDGNGEYMRGVNPSKLQVRAATESFMRLVALPAGLQHQGAKLSGGTRKLAIQAVYDACTRLCPQIAAMRGFKASVARDPRPWLEDFGIDVNKLHSPLVGEPEAPQLPIVGELGTTSLPTVGEPEAPQLPTVGELEAPAEVVKNEPKKIVPRCSVGEVPERVTSKTTEIRQHIAVAPSRLQAARAAQRAALAKTCHRAAPADDVVRIKDEHCHDTSAWGDV